MRSITADGNSFTDTETVTSPMTISQLFVSGFRCFLIFLCVIGTHMNFESFDFDCYRKITCGDENLFNMTNKLREKVNRFPLLGFFTLFLVFFSNFNAS